jgi:hypothetical protein
MIRAVRDRNTLTADLPAALITWKVLPPCSPIMNIVPLPPREIRRRFARIAGATVAFLTFATLVAPAAGLPQIRFANVPGGQAEKPADEAAVVVSLGLLHPQILSLEVVLFKVGRSIPAIRPV